MVSGSTMTEIVAANTAVEITKAVVPLATFAAGYLLSSWDRIRDSRLSWVGGDR
jgi:hypothetical protein